MTTICRGLARLSIVLASLLLCCSFSTHSAHGQRLVYRVDLRHTDEHYIDITVQPLDVRPDTMIFQMPVWSPGTYSEVHYGRFIRSFEARDSSGGELPVRRIGQDRWKITATKQPVAEIHY